MPKKIIILAALGIILAVSLPFAYQNFFSGNKKSETPYRSGNLKIVVSVFPIADIAKSVGGRNVEVLTLVPLGMDIHTYEPTAEDVNKILGADIFIYAGRGADAWAQKFSEENPNSKLVYLDASQGEEKVPILAGSDGQGHYWLYPESLPVVAQNIGNAFSKIDPDSKEYYQKNTQVVREDYQQLIRQYEILKSCPKKEVKYAGHFAFGWLASAYKLRFREGKPPVTLFDAENPSKAQREANITLLEFLNMNLSNLKTALECK